MNKETRMRKANYIRKDEINLCRFVKICYSVIERNIEGKWEYVGKVKEKGLQIRNRVYLFDDKYKLAHYKGTKILEVFEGIPEWATPKMIERYEELKNFCNKIEVEEMLGKEVTKHDCPLELLREQQKYMGLYLSILEKRALIENIVL